MPTPGALTLTVPVTCSFCQPSTMVFIPVETILLWGSDGGPRLAFTPDFTDIQAHLWLHQDEKERNG